MSFFIDVKEKRFLVGDRHFNDVDKRDRKYLHASKRKKGGANTGNDKTLQKTIRGTEKVNEKNKAKKKKVRNIAGTSECVFLLPYSPIISLSQSIPCK